MTSMKTLSMIACTVLLIAIALRLPPNLLYKKQQ
ncbi:hypothetical protein GA0116948_1037 [Chitinophaga costaii]|uniref:Uncharacterized protein n=1 Tax=Chitinophaga costaii TaxID=1335309 RepID=A0A1C4BAJ3_9BACT|nr:hypothetical protein GA0116948_1037 [Chitinophaga costaii]